MTEEDLLAIEERANRAARGPQGALDVEFPNLEISHLAEQESWRKELNRPLYHIHKWWATRLGSVFRAIVLGALLDQKDGIWPSFYSKHDLSDKVVLDPFMGSGTTLGEALKLGARAVGSDINPISTFLVRQAFTRVSEPRLRIALKDLDDKVSVSIQQFYQTIDPETSVPIPVLHYFWVKVVTLPAGETVPLFSRYVFAQDAYPSRRPKARMVCPECWSILEARYDSTEVNCPHCFNKFNPQVGPVRGQYVQDKKGVKYKIKELLGAKVPDHRMYAMVAQRENGQKVYLKPEELDFELYRLAEEKLQELDLPLPALEVRSGHNTDQARGYNYFQWREFFNPRQLLCLGLLLQAIVDIDDVEVREQFLCLFSSTLEFNNLFCSFKGEGTGAVRHMFSNHILKPERTPLENCIWGHGKRSSGTFTSLFESRLVRAKRYLDDPFELRLGDDGKTLKVTPGAAISCNLVSTWEQLQAVPASLLALNGDSSSLPLPDASVDAVVTDPPYFDFVHYSELSDFFFAWLRPVLAHRYPWMNRDHCGDSGEVQHKDPLVFASQLTLVFRECHRVLKDTGVLAFSFHHSRPTGWAAICKAISDSGFVVVAAHPVHAELRAASPKSATANPISMDAILVCRKSRTVDDRAEVDDAPIRAREIIDKLAAGGLKLSRADAAVITAAQFLVPLSQSNQSFDAVCQVLDDVCVW